MPRKKGYKHQHPYLGTMGRIRALAAFREQHIQETGKPPVWTAACYRMGIELRTVLRHAPELAAKWYDTDFRVKSLAYGRWKPKSDMGKYQPSQGRYPLTVQKIRELAEYREHHRDPLGRPPSYSRACKQIGLEQRTVRRHAPELAAKWYDTDFRLSI
jgi:hypothetical protein